MTKFSREHAISWKCGRGNARTLNSSYCSSSVTSAVWTLLTAPAASPRPCELFKVAINRQSHDGQSRSLNVSELSSELEFSFRNSKARILHVSEWHPLGNFVCARGNERARLAKNICVTDSLELKYSEPSLLISISFYFNQFINNFYRFINT